MPKPTSKPKKHKVDATSVMNDILTQLDTLTSRRRTWEDGLQRAATQELYVILEGCLTLYTRMVDSPPLRKMLTGVLKKRNVTQTAGSSLQLKVVRYVFGEGGQEYTYARTIVEAHKRKPKETAFVDWLKSEGGPSGVKQGKANKARNTQALIESAADYYETSTPITLQTAPSLSSNKDANNTFAVALVRVDPKDPTNREIVFGSNNVSLVNRVLEQAAKSLPAGSTTSRSLAGVAPSVSVRLMPLTTGGA